MFTLATEIETQAKFIQMSNCPSDYALLDITLRPPASPGIIQVDTAGLKKIGHSESFNPIDLAFFLLSFSQGAALACRAAELDGLEIVVHSMSLHEVDSREYSLFRAGTSLTSTLKAAQKRDDRTFARVGLKPSTSFYMQAGVEVVSDTQSEQDDQIELPAVFSRRLSANTVSLGDLEAAVAAVDCPTRTMVGCSVKLNVDAERIFESPLADGKMVPCYLRNVDFRGLCSSIRTEP